MTEDLVREYLIKRIYNCTTINELQVFWDNIAPSSQRDPFVKIAKEQIKTELMK